MLDEKVLDEIKEYEEAGINVVAVGTGGTLEYATTGLGDSKFCDQCSAFSLLPDPDPTDWFRDGDQKAVCNECNAVIAGGLERPSEMTKIEKPIWCPKLGRELTEEEKKMADSFLKWAQERME